MKAEYDFSKGKRGALIPTPGKTRISIFIDNAVLAAFRQRAEAAGMGYQTMVNEALKQYLAEVAKPLTEKRLREILGEFLSADVKRSRRAGRAKSAALKTSQSRPTTRRGN